MRVSANSVSHWQPRPPARAPASSLTTREHTVRVGSRSLLAGCGSELAVEVPAAHRPRHFVLPSLRAGATGDTLVSDAKGPTMNERGAQAPVIRVLIVADDDLFRTGLASLLGAHADIEVVAQASGGRMGVQLASELRPDVVLMDLPMPDLQVREAIRTILELSPATRVLAVTMLPGEEDVADALQAGASGVLARDAPVDDIVAAVRDAAGGSAWLSPRAGELMLEGLRRADPDREQDSAKLDHLSPRELDVLRLIARGLENAEIAEVLNISLRTVKDYVWSIRTKLGSPRGDG
jgi:DNA-binding NarL/FixJ family response regulator